MFKTVSRNGSSVASTCGLNILTVQLFSIFYFFFDKVTGCSHAHIFRNYVSIFRGLADRFNAFEDWARAETANTNDGVINK